MKRDYRNEWFGAPLSLERNDKINRINELILGKTRYEWFEYLQDNNCDLSIVPWDDLCEAWSEILTIRPELVDKIDFKTMDVRDIATLVDAHFSLVKDKVPWDKMPKRDFAHDLRYNPEIIKYDAIQYDWGKVMYRNPELIKYCKPETITDPAAVGWIIRRHKRFAKYFSPAMLKKAQKFLAAQDKKEGKRAKLFDYETAEEALAKIFGEFPDKSKVSETEYQDYLLQHFPQKSKVLKTEKKLKQGFFADRIKFEYFLTGENDWHSEDITHNVIDRNPSITTLNVNDKEMLIRPDLPLKSDEEYLREPDCATFALRTIVNGRIIWDNTDLSTLLAMYKNDGEYKPFGCGCGYSECAGIPDYYKIKTVHTGEHVILNMNKYNQGQKCDALCYKFYVCSRKSPRKSCSDDVFKAQNEICEFKFDKYEFKQQIFAIISSRIAIENIHRVWDTPEEDQQPVSGRSRFYTGGYIGARLARLFCTDESHGKYEVETSKAIRKLRQEMIMEAIKYHKEHYQPQEEEQEVKQVTE